MQVGHHANHTSGLQQRSHTAKRQYGVTHVKAPQHWHRVNFNGRRASYSVNNTALLDTAPVVQPNAVPSAALVHANDKIANALVRKLPAAGKDLMATALSLVYNCPSPQQQTASNERRPIERAVQLALDLAELSYAGLPLGPEVLAAAIVAESSCLSLDTIRLKLGAAVAALAHDILRVRSAPRRVERFDDAAASAIREWCIAFNDIRASVVEVVSRWNELRTAVASASVPAYEQQQLALEALQVYAPLGHALGLGALSSAMEDLCFQVLFPDSYRNTSHWLRAITNPGEQALYAAQQQLLQALDNHPMFKKLAAGCVLRTRTKSLFSMMKKLLRMGDMSKGGRAPHQVYDLLGMRAIVIPRHDLPPEQAEEAATEACYVVQEVASELWRVLPGRTKNYVLQPKPNGYRSIHMTVSLDKLIQGTDQSAPVVITSAVLPEAPALQESMSSNRDDSSSVDTSITSDDETDASSTWHVPIPKDSHDFIPGLSPRTPFVELQIRTQAMDERAESGDAAHAMYKGGLDVRQARQLQEWSQALQQRLTHGKLLLPPSVVAKHTGSQLEAVTAS